MMAMSTRLLFIFLDFIYGNDAIICTTEVFDIRSLIGTCRDQIELIKDNCPLKPQSNYNCRNQNLKNMSYIEGNTTYCGLDISKNDIIRLDNGTFREWSNLIVLDLSKNEKMLEIQPDAFKGLHNLRFLNLKHTGIAKISNNLRFSEAFRHLPELSIMDLTQNNFDSYDLIGKALNHTRQLNCLALEGCSSCSFGPEFGTLKQLTTLDQTGEEEWSSCFIETLQGNYFENLPFLKFVYLSDCAIQEISPDAFTPLSQIEILDLSYNYNLTFDRAAIGLQGLRNATSLRMLRLNYIHTPFLGHSIIVMKNHLKFLSNLPVQELQLEGNKIDVFEYGVFSALPDTLQAVSLRANRIAIDYYMDEFFDNNHVLKNLKVIDVSHQHSVYVDENPKNFLLEPTKLKKRALQSTIIKYIFMQFVPEVAFPSNLEKIICEHMGWTFPIPELHASSNNKLKDINLSYNDMHSWIGPVTGLNQLQNLSLAYNYCDNVSYVFFSNFDGLKRLNVEGNFLGFVLGHDSDGIIFSSLKSLQYLNISSNKISKLPPMIFQHIVSLEELIISYNMLSKWEIDIQKMTNLTKIDMSYNKIETLPNNFTRHIDEIAKNHHVAINLKGNPISCACENIAFLRWMMETKVQLTYDNICGKETKSDIEQKLKSLEKECTSKIGLIAGCIAFIVLVFAVIFGGIIYRYKWHLRYLYYSARNTLGIRHQGDDYNELYQYDSFLSYADEDKPFVYNGILPEIEEKFGLRLCLADRDFTPGVSIPENIIRAISSSRRTVFVFSKSFLESYWCKYELNMARIESEKKDRKLVIVVMYEKVPNDILPLDAMEIIRNHTYIDYPEDERAREAFWRRLKETID